MVTVFIERFEIEISRLIEELNLYKSEEDIWKIKEGISNSAGNLTLHLTGNLNYFIGTILGNTGYVRERDKEFSEKNKPRVLLVQDLENVAALIRKILPIVKETEFDKEFPVPIGNKTSSTTGVLLHLATHFTYHLGQVNYHRRLVS